MEPESSFLYIQDPATGLHPQPDALNPQLPILFPKDLF